MRRLAHAAQVVAQTMLAMLREIFDEAAYTRFLQQSHLTSSRESYAAFCREREGRLARRAKCC